MHLNVLIKDIDDIQRLYHLRSAVIPVQPTDGETLTQFVEALLLFFFLTDFNKQLIIYFSFIFRISLLSIILYYTMRQGLRQPGLGGGVLQ